MGGYSNRWVDGSEGPRPRPMTVRYGLEVCKVVGWGQSGDLYQAGVKPRPVSHNGQIGVIQHYDHAGARRADDGLQVGVDSRQFKGAGEHGLHLGRRWGIRCDAGGNPIERKIILIPLLHSTHEHEHVRAHTCTHVQPFSHTPAHTCTHKQTHMRAHAHLRSYTHTHTHSVDNLPF